MLERCLPSRRSGDYALLALLFTLLSGAPALAGPYTDAGHPVSSMGAWATAVDELVRGPQDIAVPGSPPASAGLEATVLGAATGDPADTVSLGDGGSITVFLADAIHNGPGDDFAVYENGFFDLFGLFAEFAYVEVASNGLDFAEFETDTVNTSRSVPSTPSTRPTTTASLAATLSSSGRASISPIWHRTRSSSPARSI